MVIFSLVLLLSTLSETLGDLCERTQLETCQELLYSSVMFSIDGFPNVDQIKRACPPSLRYLNCIENYKEHCDFDEFGIFSSEAELTSVSDFIDEICDFNSSVHRRYREHEECLVSLRRNMTQCSEEAEQVLRDFIKHKTNVVQERDQPFVPHNAHCVRKSHTIICALANAATTCGSEAFDLGLEVIKKSHFALLSCKKMELVDLELFLFDSLGGGKIDGDLLSDIFKAFRDA